MPKIEYVSKKFNTNTYQLILQANEIIEEYQSQGYSLTLRQLYYQFVARDIIPNKQTEYKRLGSVINDARLAGMIDWYAIEDRTRNLASLPHWDGPQDIVESCSTQFRYDMWEDQRCRVEVWVEKEALAGVFSRVCTELDIPYFSCRGYVSQSEMWVAAQRLQKYIEDGQWALILHFGDHDPSGIDMTRDIRDRLSTFWADSVEVRRIALNMDQIDEHSPPPNPAKVTDSRFRGYCARYGDDSWELDALEPAVLAGLVRQEVSELVDEEKWDARAKLQEEGRKDLKLVAKKWPKVLEAIRH